MALKRSLAITQYERVVWKRQQGLPTEGVSSIAQTRDGYIWLGTRDGLVRFDGVRFVLFDKKRVPALPQNNIEDVCAGDDGTLWIAAGGIIAYKNGEFTTYTTKDGVASSSILSIVQTSDGSIWAGTFNAGLVRFKDGKFTTYDQARGLPGNLVESVFEDADKNLWISTSGGLARFSNETLTTFQTHEGLHTTRMFTAVQDHSKTLWVGTYQGLGRWNGSSFQTFTERDGLPHHRIKALLTDRDNNLWIGTPKGLVRFQDGNFSTLTEVDGLPGNDVEALLEDHEGNLWVATDGGGLIALHNSKVLNLGKPEGLTDSHAWAIAETVNRDVLVGTDKGVYRLDNNRFVPFALNTSTVYSLSEGRNGNVWVGASDGTLYRLAGDQIKAWTSANTGIASVVEEEDGSLWIGLTRGGIGRYSNGKLTFPLAGILPSNIVFTIRKDHEGSLWIGNGTQGGLSRLKDGKLTTFTTNDGLSDNSVQNIHIDADRVMWIATANGLTRLKEGKFTAYYASSGLFDDNLSKILETSDGNLWISGNRGIFSVSKKDLNDFADGKISSYSSTHFGAAQGLRTELTNYSGDSSGIQTHDGRLWFPTVKGVVVIDPRDVSINPHAPSVVIEEVFINRNLVNANGQLEIPPGRGELEFRFTALSFVAPDKVRFRYKLEGFDPDWIDAGNARVAQYTNIPPGHYQFRVIAANNDGVWNESGALVGFRLKPYFYQTRTFYALAVVALIAVGAIAYTTRVKRLKKRAEELERKVSDRTEALEKANQAKTMFLANMSHELRTPMNAVLGLTRLLLDTKQTREQRDLAETIRASGESLLTIIDDILDFSKAERSEITLENRPFVLREMVEDVIYIFRLTVADKHLDLVYRQQDIPEVITGDAARLRQILINLVSNAVKFTREGGILIRANSQPLQEGWCQLEFSVSDTGIGIPANQFETIFESFTQVDSSSTREFQGSGLGLAICKRLVELMGGSIWVESELKRGSTFYLTIPVQVPANQHVESSVKDELNKFETINDPLSNRYPLKILVADDNSINRAVAVRTLQLMGYQPAEAKNGVDVIEAVKNTSYDIIFVDLHMPEMDGVETARRLKELSADRPRVIAMTASTTERDHKRLLEAGIDDLITKPFTTEQMASMLIRWARIAQPDNPPSRANDDISTALESIRKSFGDKAIREFVAIFLRDSPLRLNAIRRAQEHADWSTVKIVAHELKGSSGSLGFVRLVRLCEALEESAADAAVSRARIDELEQEYTRVVSLMNRYVNYLMSNANDFSRMIQIK